MIGLKVFGIGLSIAGIVNTGMGIFQVTDHPQTALLVGFGTLVFGMSLYLTGKFEEFLESRSKRSPRE